MNDMGYVLALMLLLLLIFRRSMLRLTRQEIVWYTDPVMLLSGAWLIQSLMYALPIFHNRETLEGRHILYILLCHAAFLVGVLLAPRARKRSAEEAEAIQITLMMLVGLALIGLMGNAFITYDRLSVSRVPLADRFTPEGLEIARRELFSGPAGGGGGPFASLEFLASAATVYVCLIAAGVMQKLALKRWIMGALIAAAALSVMFVAFNALVIQGGRMGLVLLLMGMGLGSLMDPQRTLLRYVDRSLGRAKGGVYTLLLVAALGSVWFFATSFVKDRGGSGTPLVGLYQYHRASPAPWVEDLIAGEEDLQYALLSLSYVTVPLTTLVYYYDMPNGQFPGPYWGQYNLKGPTSFIMRRLGMVKDQLTSLEIRNEATRYLRVMGYGDNVWPTLLRDLALDVGWVGVPMVMLLLGWAAEMIMRGARQDGNFVGKVLGLLTGVLLVFSIAHSLLILETFQKAFWLCFALLIYARITKALKPAK